MANQDPRGCGLLALVAIVAVVAFLGGRASVSWPGEPSPPGAVGDTAPAIVATTWGPTPLPTPRAVFVPRATPAPAPPSAPAIEPPAVAETAEAPPDRQATRASRTRVPDREVEPTAPPPAGNAPAPSGGGTCDPSYPTVCIPPPPPDLDCSITQEREFEVLPPDPHGLDSDGDGIGCEPIRLVPGQPPGQTPAPRSPGDGATTEPGG